MIPNSFPAATPTCLICDAPVSASLARAGKLCGRGECEWRYAALQRQKKICVVCGRPLAPPELPTRICATPDCQRTALADFGRRVHERNKARSEALIQQEIEQAIRLRDRVMGAFDLREPESFPLAVIPVFTAKTVNLPERRRRTFRDHLMDLIRQSGAPPEMAPAQDRAAASIPEATPAAKAVLGMACSCCKGFCCKDGADHAYLKAETLRRYRAEHPDQRPRDVLAAYLDRVGRQTQEGSCIFHQSDGCALPRDMRSDLCNRHYCTALLEFQRNLPPAGPTRAFFVAAHFGVVQTAALVHENQMLTIPAG